MCVNGAKIGMVHMAQQKLIHKVLLRVLEEFVEVVVGTILLHSVVYLTEIVMLKRVISILRDCVLQCLTLNKYIKNVNS